MLYLQYFVVNAGGIISVSRELIGNPKSRRNRHRHGRTEGTRRAPEKRVMGYGHFTHSSS
jgi:hypothetical protein